MGNTKKEVKKIYPDLSDTHSQEDDASIDTEIVVRGLTNFTTDDKHENESNQNAENDESEGEFNNSAKKPKKTTKEGQAPNNIIPFEVNTNSETCLKETTPSEAMVLKQRSSINKVATQVKQEPAIKVSKDQLKKKAMGNNSDKDKGNRWNPLCTTLLVIVIVVVFVLVSFSIKKIFYNSTIPEGHSYRTTKDFLESIEKMKSDFPEQFPEYWRLLKNSGKRHLKKVEQQNKEDLRPLSLFVVAFEDSKNIMDCFLQKVGEAYTSQPFKSIDSSNYKSISSTSEKARRDLDEEIKQSLRGNQKFVLVKNIQELPFEAAELFMTYADEYNDMHQYPQSTIVMSAVLPNSSSGERKELEKRTATYFLDELWATRNVNNKAALWTRVGDGIIVLKKEKTDPCNSF